MAKATPDRETIITLLWAWIRQRPGLDPANYGRAEVRSITKDLHDARELLRYVEWHEHSIDAAKLAQAFKNAFMGRLSLTQRDDGKWALSYCTGQYWPTEYRRAACAVLASAIWNCWRESIPGDESAKRAFLTQNGAKNPGDYLRRVCPKREGFTRAMARRWFD